MRRILLTLSALFFITLSSFAANGHEIKIKIDGFEEKEIYLGYHYGEKQYIKDTVTLDANGYFIFKGEEALDPGVYLVIMPPNNKYFQILVAPSEQHFTIDTKKADPVEHIKIDGSQDNDIFYGYLKYLSTKISEQKKYQEELQTAKGSRKTELENKMGGLDTEVKKYHEEIVSKYPKSMAAIMIKQRMQVDMPEFEGDEKSVSLQRYRFYKKHYFDNIDLGDERVLRTPFLYERVNYYIEKLTPQHPDSLMESIDYLLGKMKPSPETFKFYLINFLNKYAGSKLVGMDAVYVHLADNYYCKGLAPWSDEEQLEKICDNARRLKPILLGKTAKNITTIDRNGKKHNLHDSKSDYTILYFWAPKCGHCKKMTPFLIDFHEKYQSKGVSIFTICKPKSGDFAECWEYIDDEKNKNMEKMLHTYDPSQRAQISFNIRSTPYLFILDKDKKIISKGIGADQLEEVMEQILLQEQEKGKNEKP